MSHITSTTETTTICDQLSELYKKGLGNEELKLKPDGTVTTKMFGSSTAFGKITAFFGNLLGYDNGTKVKEKFLEEFKDKLKTQITDSGLKPEQKQKLSNSVNTLDLEFLLNRSNNGTPAPKLTAQTLITFADREAKKIDTSINEYVTSNESAKIFAKKTTPENIKKQKTEWEARIRLLTEALNNHKQPNKENSGYHFLSETDKLNIKNFLAITPPTFSGQLKKAAVETTVAIKQTVCGSGQVTPKEYIKGKIKELQEKLDALNTTSTSDVPDPMKSQTTAPVSSTQNNASYTEQEIQNLGKLIFNALKETLNIYNEPATAKTVIHTITDWNRRPKGKDYSLALNVLKGFNTSEASHSWEHNSTTTGIIEGVIRAKSSYQPTWSSFRKGFDETDAIDTVREFLTPQKPNT